MTDQQRKVLEHELLETIIDSLERGEIDLHDLSPIASYILKHIDHLQTNDDRDHFLRALTYEWPIFKHNVKKESHERSYAN